MQQATNPDTQNWALNPLRKLIEALTLPADRAARGILLCMAVLFNLSAIAITLPALPTQLTVAPLLTAILLIGTLVQAAIAILSVITPNRRLLNTAAAVNATALLFWLIGHLVGFPLGLTLWKPEMITIQEIIPPVLDALSALVFLAAARRPAAKTPRAWITILAILPIVLLLAIVVSSGPLLIMGGNPLIGEVWLPSAPAVHMAAGETAVLPYCHTGPDGSPLAMDITQPADSAPRPAPVVIYIHGGAGMAGTRQIASDPGTAQITEIHNTLRDHGFVVASIDYRLAPLHSGRNMVEDARCSIRFLRAHAADLGIDPDRIGVYGGSHGGYLAAMLGTLGSNPAFDTPEYQGQSSDVAAVVTISAFADLEDMSGGADWMPSIIEGEFGASTAEKRAASPLTYITPGTPPFLIIHGTDDPLLSPHHSQALADALTAQGVPNTLVIIQHGGHGLAAPTPNQTQQPPTDTLVHQIIDFFQTTLNP